MSTTTSIHNFNRELAEENFSKLVIGGPSALNSLKLSSNSLGALKSCVTNLHDCYQEAPQDFLAMLSMLYVQCGSYYSFTVNSPMGEDQHVSQIRAITSFYDLSLIDDEIPTKESFIELYTKINEPDINKISEIFRDEYDYEFNDAKEEIIDTLKYLRPLVKALKEEPDSILIISCDHNYPDILPQETNDLVLDYVTKLWPSLKNSPNFLKLLED